MRKARVFLGLFLVLCGCEPPQKVPDFAVMDKSAPIKRFAKVSVALYRGADPRGHLKWLKKKGIKTVINLMTTVDYKKEAEAAGLKYFHLPMATSEAPPEETLRRFLKIVQDKSHQPVFLHCRYGIHRTGTLVAVYRMEVEEWEARKALGEARYFGFRRWHHPTLYDFIAAYKPYILKDPDKKEQEGAEPPR